MAQLSARIAAWRQSRGLSQVDLARHVGVTKGAVSLWESGDTQPTHENVALIAQVLGLSLSEFWGPLPSLRVA
jgi:repressor LexA